MVALKASVQGGFLVQGVGQDGVALASVQGYLLEQAVGHDVVAPVAV